MTSTCRMCLRTNQPNYYKLNYIYIDIIEKLSAIKLTDNVAVCCFCLVTLRKIQKFTKTVREVDSILKLSIKSQQKEFEVTNINNNILTISQTTNIKIEPCTPQDVTDNNSKKEDLVVVIDGDNEDAQIKDEIEDHPWQSSERINNDQENLCTTFEEQLNSSLDTESVTQCDDATDVSHDSPGTLPKNCISLSEAGNDNEENLYEDVSVMKLNKEVALNEPLQYNTSQTISEITNQTPLNKIIEILKQSDVEISQFKTKKDDTCANEFTQNEDLIKNSNTHTAAITIIKQKNLTLSPVNDNSDTRAQQHTNNINLNKHLKTRSDSNKILEQNKILRQVSRHKTFSCDLCSSEFYTKSNLIIHLRIHCKKTFSCRSNKHLKTHVHTDRLICVICSYKCTYQKQLQIHLRKEHPGEKPYLCNLCSCKSHNDKYLQKHKLTHLKEKPFSCAQCSYKAVNINDLNVHLRKHTLYYCDACLDKFSKKTDLIRHLKTHTNPRVKYACILCSYRCCKQSQLHIHLEGTHPGEKPYACNKCSYKSKNQKLLNCHLVSHTEREKSFSCHICSAKLLSKRSLDNHMKIHTEDKLFYCDICPFTTKIKSSVLRHLRTQHTDEKPFACDKCSYRSNTKYHLKTHLKIHALNRVKPFSCHFCSYESLTKAYLILHIRKHTAERPYSCDLCSYKAISKQCMANHILKKHTIQKDEVKQFLCEICSHKSSTKVQLIQHIKIHSDEKEFLCEKCSYKTYNKSNLQKHWNTHTGEKPFSCHKCSFKSKNKSNLNTHLRNQHTEKIIMGPLQNARNLTHKKKRDSNQTKPKKPNETKKLVLEHA